MGISSKWVNLDRKIFKAYFPQIPEIGSKYFKFFPNNLPNIVGKGITIGFSDIIVRQEGENFEFYSYDPDVVMQE